MVLPWTTDLSSCTVQVIVYIFNFITSVFKRGGESKVVPVYTKVCQGMKVLLHLYLTLALGGESGYLYSPDALMLWTGPLIDTYWMGNTGQQ